MEKKENSGKKSKLGKFFSDLLERVDKKMEEKAKNTKSCCSGGKGGDKTCCS